MPSPMGGLEYQWPFLLGALAGYLTGSIPFGLLLTRLAGLGDIRTIGSGNIGATNVLRTGRKGLALATLLLDGGKAAVPALATNLWLGRDMGIVVGLAAFLGHLFPLWLKFRGGKGVASFLGVQLALAWPVGLIACATWLAVAVIFRISSLAALVAALASPFAAWWLRDYQFAEVAAVMALFIFFKHRANILRLLRGEEPRIGGKKGRK